MRTSITAPQLAERQQRTIVLQPIGSLEQHGPYLPIDTDLRIANLISEKLEAALTHHHNVLLLPPQPISCSWEHRGLGTLALNVNTFALVMHDIARSLSRWNIPILLVLVNWHGGNDLLGALATEITAQENIPTAAIPSTAQVGKAWDESTITTAKDIHAGAVETSIVAAYWPDQVPLPIPASAHCEPDIKPAKVQPIFQAIGSDITKQGIWGAPEDADPAKGRALIEQLVESVQTQIVKVLEQVDSTATNK